MTAEGRLAGRVDATLIALGLLTAAALALRLRGIGEGLYHDELYTWVETHGRSFSGMLHAVAKGSAPNGVVERTPPLYFVLAWLASKLGSPETTIRLPSILLGTAAVPLVFLLGLRTVGRPAALFAAAFVALSPFSIFYGIEARAYGTLMFLGVLSALVLMKAVEQRRPVWWAAYAIAVVALLYTHYTSVIVIAFEAVWVLWRHRDQALALGLAGVGAVVLFAPWLPYFQSTPVAYDKLAGIVGVHDWSAFLQWVDGSPDELPGTLPGTLALVLLGVAAAIGVAGAVRARAAPWGSPGSALVLLLAVGIPVALLAYELVGENLFVYPRNMIAALPFFGLALGWLLTRPVGLLAAVAVALAAGALVIGATKTLGDRFHRPNSPAVARELDDRLAPGAPAVYYGPGFDPLIIRDLMRVYLREPHPALGADESEASLLAALALAHERSDPVQLVQFLYDRPPPVAPGWDQLERRVFAGHQPFVLSTYVPLRSGRYRGLSLAPGRVQGALDSATQKAGLLSLTGWAVTRDSRPPTHVLAYVGDRLVAAGVPNRTRPDVAKAQGLDTDEVGFMLALPGSLDKEQRARIRVIATDGRVGSSLERYCSPQIRLLLGCSVSAS